MKRDRDIESNKVSERKNPGDGRRAVLKAAAAAIIGGCSLPALTAAGGVADAAKSSANGKRTDEVNSINAAAGTAEVVTESGKASGYVRNGIYTFKGIPYAAGTEGDRRFLPPIKPQKWSGVRSCRQHGYVCPQAARTGWANDEESFLFSWDDGVQSEDCLHLNLWTPGINDGKKRPVVVWLHGGGFSAGSGQELLSYDGENLARRGDVVVVTLNHRLNVFGFLDLSKYGEQYASSANVGMLDIVSALEWVRDNIANFGGDPRLVTIFGQSGGGGKVSVLMGMPAAKGLFHRAIVESGSMLRAGNQEKSQRLADLVVAELGLTRDTIDRIRALPYQQILQAGQKVLREHNPTPAGILNFRKLADLLGFAPVVDGNVLPAHPFEPRASALSAEVPMIIGTTLNEFVTALNHPEYENMTSADLEQRVRAAFGDKAPQVLAAFRQRTPNAKPFDVWSRISASSVRQSALEQATAKAVAGGAPAYVYWFAWQTPILDGRPRAFHCSEIAFVFDNTDRCENMTGGGADARALAATMSEAWIHFARTGNPNHAGMPHWPAFSTSTSPTMIFDNRTRAENGPDADEQRSVAGT
jgi:para-nitrobenzyl esterase